MQVENIQEYEFIRQEMHKLKDCVTTYMGFVLGGSGLAIIGLVTIDPVKGNMVSYFTLVLSLVFSLVLLILLYKFTSHNRAAGYSKILNQERHIIEQKDMVDNSRFMAWEICVDQLRRSDNKPERLKSIVRKIRINISKESLEDLLWIIEKYTGTNPAIDRRKKIKGIHHLTLVLRGKVKTNSWAFPAFVVSVFAMIIFSLMLVGGYGLVTYSIDSEFIVSRNLISLWAVSAIIFIAQGYLWLTFCGKLYTLMAGSATVDGFFWRFMPIRVAYLNEYKITPFYVLAEERLAEMRRDADPKDDARTK